MAHSRMTIGLLVVFVTAQSAIGVLGLKDLMLKIPKYVKSGTTVKLVCDYDLESVALYSIKWYRNEEEFYRYIPKESPPSQVFAVPYLKVDINKSNAKEVTLNNLQRKTSGRFKCEVTSDGPLFHTDMQDASLIVVDVPQDGPTLTTDIQKTALGETIKAECFSAESSPAMNITWFLNDVEIIQDQGIHIQNFVTRSESLPALETVQSAISIKSSPDIFQNGKMKLRCLATMFTLYASSKETEIQEDAPQLALIMVPISHSSEGQAEEVQVEEESPGFRIYVNGSPLAPQDFLEQQSVESGLPCWWPTSQRHRHRKKKKAKQKSGPSRTGCLTIFFLLVIAKFLQSIAP